MAAPRARTAARRRGARVQTRTPDAGGTLRVRWRCRHAPLRTPPAAAAHAVPSVELLCFGTSASAVESGWQGPGLSGHSGSFSRSAHDPLAAPRTAAGTPRRSRPPLLVASHLRAAFQLGMGGCTALCLLPATPRACADAAPAWRAAGRSCLSARTRGAAARGARRLRAGGCAARRSIMESLSRSARASRLACTGMLLHQLSSPAAAPGAWLWRGHAAARHLGESTAQTACVRQWNCRGGGARLFALLRNRYAQAADAHPQATHVQHAHAR